MRTIEKAFISQGSTPEEAQERSQEIKAIASDMLNEENYCIDDYEQLLADEGLEPDYLMDLLGC